MKKILTLMLLITIAFIPISTSAEETEHIKTINITKDTLTETSKQVILSDLEIEELVNSAAKKSFSEITSISVNHIGRDITIKYIINESDGTVENLINTGIFNYFGLTKNFNLYNVNFEIDVRYKDTNNRFVKKHMYSYTFNNETLKTLEWEKLSYKDFVKNADKTWTFSEGEITNKKNKEDDLQLKIINIFKTYIQYKLNESSEK